MSMGDPAGIGPEICLKSALNEEVMALMHPIVVGDYCRLTEVQEKVVPSHVNLVRISSLRDLRDDQNVVNVYDLKNVPVNLQWGAVSEISGRACYEYLETAAKLALAREVDAICTAPINKESWKVAGIPYIGHTEALAGITGSTSTRMLLTNKNLRVAHVTTHIPLSKAVLEISQQRIYETILLLNQFLRRSGFSSPRISVAGINPHAGENGLMGHEEIETIIPAIEQARIDGMNVYGPLPPDTAFARAADGEFDAVVALYHDQGHIPIKMLGMDSGVNLTLGIPIIRTSVDHGTAFDIAGKGVARANSMIAAMIVAAKLAS